MISLQQYQVIVQYSYFRIIHVNTFFILGTGKEVLKNGEIKKGSALS